MQITPELQERLIKGKAWLDQHQEKSADELEAMMRQTRDNFMAEVNGLNEAQMGWSPGEGQWSVKEVCLHVSNAIGLCAFLIDALSKGIELEQAKDIKMGVLDPDPGSIVAVRENVGMAFEKAIKVYDVLRNDPNLTAQSPHPWFGPLNCPGWAAFNILHATVHVRQVQRVKGTAGFPK